MCGSIRTLAEGDMARLPSLHSLSLNLRTSWTNRLGAEGAKGLCWMERMPALHTLTLNLRDNLLGAESLVPFGNPPKEIGPCRPDKKGGQRQADEKIRIQ